MKKTLILLCLAVLLMALPVCHAEPDGAGAYLYCVQGGMPKYWLDLTGEDEAILHCWFRSSDPTFYERLYTLDLKSAEVQGDAVSIHRITDDFGFDRSAWFPLLRWHPEGEMLVLEVERDEKTLAGGSEDNVLTGEYWMEPMRVGKDGDEVFLRPLKDGPYTPSELGRLAQLQYFMKTGFYPPRIETDVNQNGTITVHLFEVVDIDGIKHTATSAWYTVNADGIGTDDIMGVEIDLTAFRTK